MRKRLCQPILFEDDRFKTISAILKMAYAAVRSNLNGTELYCCLMRFSRQAQRLNGDLSGRLCGSKHRTEKWCDTADEILEYSGDDRLRDVITCRRSG